MPSLLFATALIAGGLQARAALREREGDAEGRALAGLAGDTDMAGVFLDDAVADGEAEARAAPDAFGGEERIVDARDVFL